VPANVKQPTVHKQLAKVCKLFHMNELEIAVWSLWVEEQGWTGESMNLEDFLLITAMQVKVYKGRA